MSSDRTLPKPPTATPPSKHELALMIWLAVFPTLTLLNLALGGLLKDVHRLRARLVTHRATA